MGEACTMADSYILSLGDLRYSAYFQWKNTVGMWLTGNRNGKIKKGTIANLTFNSYCSLMALDEF